MKKWIIAVISGIVIVTIGTLFILNSTQTSLSSTVITNGRSVPAGQLLRLTFKANNGQSKWLNVTPQEGKNPDQGGYVFGTPGGKLYVSSEDGKQHYVTSFPKGIDNVHLDLGWYVDGDTAVFENLSGSDKNSAKQVIRFKLIQ